jgi:dCMP deaminase
MKLDHSGSDFIEHIKKILIHNQYHEQISEKKLLTFHERAVVIASQSHDSQTKVAALLIDCKTLAVLAEGFNGFIRGGRDDRLPSTRPEKYNYIIHAETNLLCNSVRAGIKMDGGIIYCILSPCVKCLRMLWQAGIKVIYFKDKYSDFYESCSMLDLNVKVENIGAFHKISLSPKV